MRSFKYRAVSRSGATVTGMIEARDEFDATNKIKQSFPMVLEVSEAGGKPVDLFANKKVKEANLALVCTQFSIILSAGLPLVRCVELVEQRITDKALKRILKEAAEDVAAGSPLSSAFEKRGPQLPATFIESLKAGEESGDLGSTFERLGAYYSKIAKTKQSVHSALVYPIFVLCVAAVVVAIIMLYAMPQFSSTFESLGTELPAVTRAMIAVSNFFQHNYLVIAAVIIAIVLARKIYAATPAGKLNLAKLSLAIPITGRIVQMSNASQFASTMSTMVASGIPIVRAVAVTGRSMNNRAMGADVEASAAQLETGRRLAASLSKSKYLPALLVEMIGVGEETGSLEQTLSVIGRYYDNETDTATKRALSLMEPVLIVILAVFVFLILIAVYLPIFSMYGSV